MESMALPLLYLAFLSYMLGILAGAICVNKGQIGAVLTFGAAALGGGFGLLAAISFLGAHNLPTLNAELLPLSLPNVGLTIRLDSLSAFFTLIISVVGLALSIYSVGYARDFAMRKSVGVMGSLFNALLLATSIVFLADNAFSFVFVWEIMAAVSYLLISFEHEDSETRRAGIVFFVMSHIGTGCLILGFLLLFQASGSYSFSSFHNIGMSMASGPRDAAFLLFVIGFGVKAGIVPFHIWLPVAHPVAPSNVSALLSGVIIKTGIYGLTRVCFDFLGEPPLWWGVVILVMGTISALIGVLYALMEHDLKRLLAYHSIENIGIIWMGLGAALIFLTTHHPVLAALALIAGLYHTLNHAIFKALLFLGAGAVLHSTGLRNMEEMGGLVKRMPRTALYFLIGSVAISALPPLNGFVSEWLTYQALLQGFNATPSLARLLFPIGAALLALTGALAAACFVKAFAITFLAQPRSARAAQAHEVSKTMLAGMGMLSALCFGLGLFPAQFVAIFDSLTLQLTGCAISGQIGSDTVILSGLGENAETLAPLGIGIAAICLLPIPLALWWWFGRGAERRVGPTWDCGLRELTPRMEYTATGFSKPLRIIFRGIFRPHRALSSSFEFSRYFATTIRFETRVEETFEKRFYRPMQRLILVGSRRMRALQAGSLQAYLIYIFVTFLILLVVCL